jgi:hypothetical protein
MPGIARTVAGADGITQSCILISTRVDPSVVNGAMLGIEKETTVPEFRAMDWFAAIGPVQAKAAKPTRSTRFSFLNLKTDGKIIVCPVCRFHI